MQHAQSILATLRRLNILTRPGSWPILVARCSKHQGNSGCPPRSVDFLRLWFSQWADAPVREAGGMAVSMFRTSAHPRAKRGPRLKQEQVMTTTATSFNYPSAAAPVYSIAEGASLGDLSDMLSARLAHLDAILAMTHGEAGEAFRTFRSDTQDTYLWGCRQLATECRELFEQVAARASHGTK